MADAKDFLEKLSPEQKVVWAALQVARKNLDAAERDLGRGSGVARCREAQDVLNRAKEAWAAVKAVTP